MTANNSLNGQAGAKIAICPSMGTTKLKDTNGNLLNDYVRLSYGMASYACGDRLNPGNYVDPRSFRPLAVFVAPALALANAAAAFDTHVIDGAVMGVGKLVGGGSQVLRRIQTGLVRRYVMTMLGGIVLVVAIFLLRVH